MKNRQIILLALAIFALTACHRGETATVTGGYGTNVVSGNVVMASGASPAGVQVSVRGTGMTSTVGTDGQFVFAGVPDDGVLDFRSLDGIEGSLALDGSSSLTIELSPAGAARKGGKRRGAGRGDPLTQFEGVIRSATAEQIVVFTSHKEEVTIALTPTTTIRKGNTVLTPADLVVDTRVHVKAVKTDTGFNAVAILVQNGEDDGGEDDRPAVKEYEGTVISAAAEQLVIFDSHRTEQTFVLNADTVIRKGQTPVLATDIQPGWRVHVKATGAADGTKTATLVIVQNDREVDDEVRLNGTITTTAPALTVQTGTGTFTITTDASTKIEKKGHEIVLTDLAVGDRVKVQGTKVDATTVLAKEIEVK